MLNFALFRARKTTFAQLTAGLGRNDLHRLTNEMVDKMLFLIANCSDADVVFEPSDPEAHDSYAVNEAEISLAWTLGHVIVHTTASAEESAFLAAEMARGVPPERRRSRYEIPWQTVTAVAQCRHRLEESRRMRLASLEMWPDDPCLDNTYAPWSSIGEINAVGRFVLGLKHDNDHLAQIANIVQQAKASDS